MQPWESGTLSSTIASSFDSSFGLSGSLGVGTASILGADAQGTPNAASIAASGQTATGALAALQVSATNSNQQPTIEALGQGKLTGKQHKIIAALGAAPKNTLSVPWNANGTEPTVVSQIRKYGWIKLVKPTYDTKTRLVGSATYQLTKIGLAIYKRTGGGTLSTTASTSSGVNLLA